ncbi:MAG: AraC family transcriptional regulator [Candidatus Omnitrophica bacterium]|nr:AraC family transcriptional regulator [Candidatus Omnitrophota bacterium]MCM8828436.1 AraC family transcriptional regulator [Candidatus Omnitrophota bacterium]
MPSVKKYIQKIFDGTGFPVKIAHARGYGETFPSHRLHYHTADLEMQFIKKGEGFYFIKNRRYAVKPSSALVIHSNEVHHFFSGGAKNFIDKTSVMLYPGIFKKTFIEKHISSLIYCNKNFPHQIFFSDKEFSIIEFLLDAADSEIKQQNKFWKESTTNFIEQICLLLLRRIEEGQAINRQANTNKIVQSAISYIEQNFAREITLKSLSKELNVSRFHLSHLFTQYAGVSFKTYLIRRRVEEAKKLLKETDLKVSGISGRSGFSDISSFVKSFKRITGASPASYRKIFQQLSKK